MRSNFLDFILPFRVVLASLFSGCLEELFQYAIDVVACDRVAILRSNERGVLFVPIWGVR